MTRKISRREFVGGAAAIGAGFWVTGRQPLWAQEKGPNAKVSVACVGVGGKGAGEMEGVRLAGDTIVAICDVDENSLNAASKKFPEAKRYNDYREMFEKDAKTFDAVTVSTPDHHHFPASMLAIKAGKHVYTQKPLVHSVWEARKIAEAAREHRVVTQMGNQGHASDARRAQVELLQAGVLGNVTEVHAWTNRPIWAQAMDRPKEAQPVPAHLKWDLFLGPAPERPYHKCYHPFSWRGWWDFGTGALGDMACHIMDAPFWGLGLGYPVSVESEGNPLHPETGPSWMIVRLKFPARGSKPPVAFTWYDGGKMPPAELAHGAKLGNNGYIIVGDKGSLVALDEQGQKVRLFPEELAAVKVAPTIPRTGGGHEWGNHREWLEAIKGKGKAQCSFDYAGPFTESVLIGIAAFRAGKKLEWDGAAMKATNCPEADKFIRREYRKGWEV